MTKFVRWLEQKGYGGRDRYTEKIWLTNVKMNDDPLLQMLIGFMLQCLSENKINTIIPLIPEYNNHEDFFNELKRRIEA